MVIPARYISRGEHLNYTRDGPDCFEIHMPHPGVRPFAGTDCRVKRAPWLWDIVNISGLTGDVQVSTLMRDALTHTTEIVGIGHGPCSP
jgi:hypothetical protein